MIAADARGHWTNLPPAGARAWHPNRCETLPKDDLPVIDILNSALPYFGVIFVGLALRQGQGLSEAGLAWMNFFLLHVSLPALLFGIVSRTRFAELNKSLPATETWRSANLAAPGSRQ